jgi:hypothetical protein
MEEGLWGAASQVLYELPGLLPAPRGGTPSLPFILSNIDRFQANPVSYHYQSPTKYVNMWTMHHNFTHYLPL